MTAKPKDFYPLSPMQEALLFQVLYSPGSGVNVVQSVYALSGNMDVSAFEFALQTVLTRHPALRTFFLWKGLKNPIQVVDNDCKVGLEKKDWHGAPAEEQEARLLEWLRADRKRAFDLTHAPLIRFTLIRMGDREQTFIWSWHHMLLDGWSVQNVMQEVFAIYKGQTTGQLEELPPVRPFRDYITWLQRQDMSEAERYWRRILRDITVPEGGPVYKYHATPGDDDNRNRFEDSTVLSADLTSRLQAAARRCHVTLNTFMQGALAILLSKYYGQKDVVFGEMMVGRPAELEGIEKMAGLFLNSLPVRAIVDDQASLGHWLQQLQANQAEARRYDYTPLFKLREWSNMPPTAPLFKAVMVFQNVSLYDYDSSDSYSTASPYSLRISSGRHFAQGDNNQMLFIVEPGSDTALTLISDSSLMESGAGKTMLAQMEKLLEGMAAEIEPKIRDLDIVTEAEQNRMLQEWNQPAVEVAANKCLHHLFEEQAEKTPDAIAAVDGEMALSYRQLNRRAQALAGRLRAAGARPEVRIGVFMERSVEILVALLGILKTGAAYVPLDASYPPERLRFMITDSGADCIVTETRMVAKLPVENARLICLDGDESEGQHDLDDTQKDWIDSCSLAYVIYTSGSTGLPKGVGITHGNAVAMVQGTRVEFTSSEMRRMLASTSLCFDLSIFELFVPLSVGSTAVILENALEVMKLDPRDVTFVNTVPSLMAELLKTGWTAPRLPIVALAGEALHRKLVSDLYDLCGVEKVYNLYGPTEDTTYSTVKAVGRDDEREPSIGKAIKGGQTYILDTALQLVPVGAIGELYLGGAGLARGYLGKGDLTAERFVPNPYGQIPGERVYKTGDRARYRSDGDIEFLGRFDHQVKLRGLRIELGEIEAFLLTHPGVRQAVVLDRMGDAGHLELVAYVVAQPNQPLDVEGLRSHLGQNLPGYSVPSRFMMVDEIPLTPNGKIDRKALLERSRWERSSQYVPPSDWLELRLIQIWESVLNVRPIGRTDRFIDLGGHSFLAIRLVAQIQKQFGEVIDLRTIVDLDTIANVAEVLHGKVAAPAYSPLVPIQPKGRDLPLYCVHGIGGQALEFYPLARRLGEDLPFYGLQANQAAHNGDGAEAIETIAATYLQAIRVVQPEGPYRLAGYSFGGVVAFEMAQQLRQNHQAIASLVLIDATSPLVIQQFPQDVEDDEGGQQLGYMAMVFRERARAMGKSFAPPREELQALPADLRFKFLFEKLKESNLIEADISEEIGLGYLRGIIRQMKARNWAMRNYKPEKYHGNITFIRCAEPPPLPPGIERRAVEAAELRYGWSSLSTEAVDTYEIPGSHESMIQEPYVKALADRLAAALGRPMTRSENG